jgi:hypothetical protein
LELKALGGNRYEFQAPECAIDRDLDLQEAQEMRLASEGEIARDELLYLVADCRGFLEAYLQLAELALEEEDIGLAKGHFGFAYERRLQQTLLRGWTRFGALPGFEKGIGESAGSAGTAVAIRSR